MSCPRDIDNAGVGDLPASHKEGVDGLPLPRFSEAPSNLQVSLSRVRSAQRFSDEFPPSPDTVPTPEASSKAVSTDFEPAATLADTWAMSMSTSRAEGKRAARAIDIMPRRPASGVYGVPGQSSGGCSSSSAGPSTATSPIAIPIYAATDDLPHTAPGDDRMEILQDLVEEIVSFSKNKEGEETVPTLPPLSFPSSQFSPDDFYPASSSTSGPSSFGSTFSAPLSSPSINHAGHARRTLTAPMEPLTRMPSRRRSLSNLSIHSSHSVTTRVKGKLRSASPARLVRRIFSKNDGPVSAPVSPLATPRNGGDESAGCFTPWRWDAKQRFREPIDLDRLLYDGTDLAKAHALYWPNVLPAETGMLGAKGRSYSDPFPSVFDVVLPATGRDTFIPLEQAATPPPPPRSAFVDRLPRELQLHILGFVVGIYEQEHARRVREGEWTALTAAKHKWVGREQGVRELVRMSRVCKAWHSLVFDGQLWTTLDLRAFPKLSSTSIMQLGRAAGYLAGSLDLAGHANLQSSTLEHLTNSLSASAGPFVGETRLTNLNLAGCRALTTVALHYILERSPAIELLNVKGVPGVTNETCEVLSRSCPHLTTLNMSRCKSLSGLGIRLLTARALGAGCPLPLRDLRLCGMKGVTDGVLKDLGRAAPYLEVLDLSYCRDLHNTSLGAFVAVEDEANSSSTVLLSARQAGLPGNQSSPFRRRITRLRHLSLSHCPLLTDDACAHLAHATPSLELLELAGIEALQDEGLVLLLRTLPRLRKLDLEDAKNLSNAVLRALMPQENVPCALEHLTMSGCSFSNEPLLAFMQAAPRLRVLEADNSFISSAAAGEFVALARARAARDAVLVAIDSHTVSANTVNELASATRPRLGWRAHAARKLAYVDGADKESCVQNEGGPQDECDPARVVLKTFFGWLEVDKVAAARQKRRRAARQLNTSGETAPSEGEEEVGGAARARWWAPGGAGRRSSMAATAAMLEIGNERDGCVVM